MVKKIIITAVLVFLATSIMFMISLDLLDAHATATTSQKPQIETKIPTPEPKVAETPTLSTTEPDSLWVIANKNQALPYAYRPASLRTPNIPLRGKPSAENMQLRSDIITQLEAMHAAAKNDNLNFALVSGFRSAQTQERVYNGYVADYGQAEADRFSARPGTSEHQTGLAFDLGLPSGHYELEQGFGGTAEGKWLAAHAHEFGFIVRYPPNKESITGYMYEPWHFRYVGADLAGKLFAQNLTMEEYFGYAQ